MEEAAPEAPEDLGAEGDQAAAKLQAVTRGRNQRKMDVQKQQEAKSAERIQAISRGRKGREKAALKHGAAGVSPAVMLRMHAGARRRSGGRP